MARNYSVVCIVNKQYAAVAAAAVYCDVGVNRRKLIADGSARSPHSCIAAAVARQPRSTPRLGHALAARLPSSRWMQPLHHRQVCVAS